MGSSFTGTHLMIEVRAGRNITHAAACSHRDAAAAAATMTDWQDTGHSVAIETRFWKYLLKPRAGVRGI